MKNEEQSSSLRILVFFIMVQWCKDRGFVVEFLKKFYINVSIEFFSQAALPVPQWLLRYIVNIFNIVKLSYFRDRGST